MKSNKSRQRNKSFNWRPIAGIMIIVVIIGIGLAFGYTTRRWNGKDRFTVVVTNPILEIESFDPVSGKGIKIKIPGNMEIQSVGGRGVWMAEVMPRLGVKYGWKWVGESVADYLGIGYTSVDRQMSLWDKWEWWRHTSGLGWKEVTLDSSPLVEEIRSADGIVGLRITAGWADKAREWFTSVGIANEGVGITLVNTTNTIGLGSHAARQIDSSGMSVVMVSNDGGNINGCQIEAAGKLKDSLSAAYLQRVFGCKEIKTAAGEGEITLKLGQEYRNWWLGKNEAN